MSLESAFQKISEEKKEKTEIASDVFGEKKQKRMSVVEQKIKQLDERGIIQWEDSGNRITLKYNEKAKNDKKFICAFKGDEYELSLGDIIADYNWGIKYLPDQEIPKNVYRQLSKRILTNEARRDLEKIRDAEDVASGNISKKGALDFEHSEREQGRIAEEMVQELITRISYSLPSVADFYIKVIRASQVEDMRKKIDFKIDIIDQRRGVKTVDEEDFDKHDRQLRKMGLQVAVSGGSRSVNSKSFKRYLMTKKAKIEASIRKYGELLDVDDIVLVAFHIKQSKERYYNKWQEMGRPPGGPEQYIPLDKKKEIFKIVTQSFKIDISDGELEKILITHNI